ncbi:MAG TPA: hypothetical protein PK718_06260 [Candidatus Methanofastidiosa archaeon]|nr:hypothetical protein [Candidatus Methanofastidiosa archaeon]HPR42135.1 hypothetical protein [Candidatus Methanofastidiosa archaeon]
MEVLRASIIAGLAAIHLYEKMEATAQNEGSSGRCRGIEDAYRKVSDVAFGN